MDSRHPKKFNTMKKNRLFNGILTLTGLIGIVATSANAQTTVIQFNESVSSWQTAYDTTDVDVNFVSNLFEYNNPGYNDLNNVGWTNRQFQWQWRGDQLRDI
jgi:hypothetical protein